MRIDAHQHFWKLSNDFTDWPSPDLAAIYHDYGAPEIAPLLQACAIDGTILVQAAPNEEETRYLLSIADNNDWVLGVVGWIDFESPSALGRLAAFSKHPRFKGVRPMLQGIEQPDWVLREAFTPIFRHLASSGLAFDGLVRASQICELATLARRYPDLRIVLDHAGKPDIAHGQFADWARQIAGFAAAPNAYCKLSGLWTEAGGDHADARIAPYVTVLLEQFGPGRLMWGSDWPVLELAGHYADWIEQCQRLLASIGSDGQRAVFGATAARFYGVGNA